MDDLVEYFLSDDWVDDNDVEALTQANLQDILARITTAQQIHQMVDGFNWDTGTDELKQLLTHPLADSATLLMAYWRSNPAFYLEHQTKPDMDKYVDSSFEFVEWCSDRLSPDVLKTARLSYNPRNDRGYDMTHEYQRVLRKMELGIIKSKQRIPEYLISPVNDGPLELAK